MKTYNVEGDVKNIIVWYSKFHYKTTGDILKDFKIILGNIYCTEDWQEVDVARILIRHFSDLMKDNFETLIGNSIYNSSHFFANYDDIDSKVIFIRTVKSLIAGLTLKELEGLDENYKGMFYLEGR